MLRNAGTGPNKFSYAAPCFIIVSTSKVFKIIAAITCTLQLLCTYMPGLLARYGLHSRATYDLGIIGLHEGIFMTIAVWLCLLVY
jgi:hypothetical protein